MAPKPYSGYTSPDRPGTAASEQSAQAGERILRGLAFRRRSLHASPSQPSQPGHSLILPTLLAWHRSQRHNGTTAQRSPYSYLLHPNHLVTPCPPPQPQPQSGLTTYPVNNHPSTHPHPPPPFLTILTILQPTTANSQFTPTHSHLRPSPGVIVHNTYLPYPSCIAITTTSLGVP